MQYLTVLLAIVVTASVSFNFYLYRELSYYRSVSYDASRFAEVEPQIQDKI